MLQTEAESLQTNNQHAHYHTSHNPAHEIPNTHSMKPPTHPTLEGVVHPCNFHIVVKP